MLHFFRTCVLALGFMAGIASAHASMSGPIVFREEVIRRLEALSFPWSLAAKLGVDKSLSQFEWWEDLKALQDMVGEVASLPEPQRAS